MRMMAEELFRFEAQNAARIAALLGGTSGG